MKFQWSASALKTFADSTIHWITALSVAIVQNGIAIFAVYSSSQDRLSDGACIGGFVGGLLSLAILAVVVIWSITLAVRSFGNARWHKGLKPLSAVALSTVMAIFIGMNAVLSCSV